MFTAPIFCFLQVFRDVRIASLWEGTTQIQALDLLGRKILLGKLKPINEVCANDAPQLDGRRAILSHRYVQLDPYPICTQSILYDSLFI